ncbi:alpha/beta hydrolase [Novosphingobium fuchskuhlense]|uniref:Palmitoyl-protein thioesterase ABHD10, mitochondrial n=1 Tax=Novosphingobium fuchskuhlense TaxID=1117702 RepID=A0A117UWJ8_9SPHN|nr:alpha/beta hydrolase [Novosphingobium fuchskuhlense]KUR72171.1 alpha/beta hydrolase [Novosphingobium fuchskuhlense]
MIQHFTLPSGERMAYRFLPGPKPDPTPTIVFLPGYMSDMSGGKAQAVIADAEAKGRACLLLDYTGLGQSEGVFAEKSLPLWREEVIALLDGLGIERVILVGSSMGGWLMLLLAEALGTRVAALVGLAPAPDFCEWGFDAAQKAVFARGEPVYEENIYGPEPTPTYAKFWAAGMECLRLARGVAFDGPVRLIHGQADRDVPWDISIRLAAALRSADVQVHLIKDGDHRLSRRADIAILLGQLDALFAA